MSEVEQQKKKKSKIKVNERRNKSVFVYFFFALLPSCVQFLLQNPLKQVLHFCAPLVRSLYFVSSLVRVVFAHFALQKKRPFSRIVFAFANWCVIQQKRPNIIEVLFPRCIFFVLFFFPRDVAFNRATVKCLNAKRCLHNIEAMSNKNERTGFS